MRDEISIMATLDHPSVVKFIESFEDDRYIFIVMEVMRDAIELKRLVYNRKQDSAYNSSQALFSEEMVMHIMYKLIAGINHVHSSGVVHRDLKLENILID
jgi:serine/threonine protein kinase